MYPSSPRGTILLYNVTLEWCLKKPQIFQQYCYRLWDANGDSQNIYHMDRIIKAKCTNLNFQLQFFCLY